MKNICLIDADSTIPNLALMKISSHYKSLGYSVDLKKLNIPYYPNKKKPTHNIDTSNYDLSFCSVIFKGNSDFIKGDHIEFGGTGFDKMKKLPDYIESLNPDYSIYPDNKKSYGFISRGCNRKCYFCDVWVKEGENNQVAMVNQIVRRGTIGVFLDNNFLQLKNHCEILQELIDKKTRCQFNQGLDIRLINKENSFLLSKLRYSGDYIFAFDDLKYKSIIEKKLNLMKWRKLFKFKFFVYVNPQMEIKETVDRINILKEWKCLPYIMRDLSCWGSENEKFYTDIASWCNQPSLFRKMKFSEFLKKRHVDKVRIKNSENLYNKIKKGY